MRDTLKAPVFFWMHFAPSSRDQSMTTCLVCVFRWAHKMLRRYACVDTVLCYSVTNFPSSTFLQHLYEHESAPIHCRDKRQPPYFPHDMQYSTDFVLGHRQRETHESASLISLQHAGWIWKGLIWNGEVFSALHQIYIFDISIYLFFTCRHYATSEDTKITNPPVEYALCNANEAPVDTFDLRHVSTLDICSDPCFLQTQLDAFAPAVPSI